LNPAEVPIESRIFSPRGERFTSGLPPEVSETIRFLRIISPGEGFEVILNLGVLLLSIH